MTIAFVQPFGVHSPGGGPRILRALLEERPVDVVSISTSSTAPPPTSLAPESHQRIRPTFGRLEPTRYNRFLGVAAIPCEPLVRRRMRRRFTEHGADAVHLVLHDASFWAPYLAARDLDLPVAITVHDHLDYNLRGRPERALGLRRLGQVWRDADRRFAISAAIVDEYGGRFGSRPAEIVTDGLTSVSPPAPVTPDRFRVYFMGAFHMSYRTNLEALLRGLEAFQRMRPDVKVSLRMRCGALPGGLPPSSVEIEALPFGDESAVIADMQTSDVLWLPLPFGDEHRSFVRYSLSTKMVTYLGAGLPILYHGPSGAEAGRVLREAGAASEANSLRADEIAAAVASAADNREPLALRAGALAESHFMVPGLRVAFWNSLTQLLPPQRP